MVHSIDINVLHVDVNKKAFNSIHEFGTYIVVVSFIVFTDDVRSVHVARATTLAPVFLKIPSPLSISHIWLQQNYVMINETFLNNHALA